MSSQTLDLIPDLDIEEELGSEDYRHAFAVCSVHRYQEPVSGTIIETLCKKLIRYVKGRDTHKDKCPVCLKHFNVPGSNCWVCGVPA